MGTILPYVGSINDIPSGWYLCDGTNGTPDLRDRFLEGSDIPKQFINPGLPNIEGKFTIDFTGGPAGVLTSGPFYYPGFYDGWDGSAPGQYYSTGRRSCWVGFNAAKANAIYGASNTVQPAAYTVYYIIKQK